MLGKLINSAGIAHESENATIIHLLLDKGNIINPHKHQGNEVYFVVIKGEITVLLEDEEQHTLKAGEILNFDGDVNMGLISKIDSEAYTFLVAKHDGEQHHVCAHH